MKKKYLTLLLVVLTLNLIVSPQIFAETSEPETPTIESEAAILLEADSGQVLYSKNEEKEMYPASLTKMATAIYAIEKGNLDDVVTISANAVDVDGTTVFLVEEEKVLLKQLIQGMLINSGNDASVAIAEHLSGSVKKFSEDLNTYLTKVIGIKDTQLNNPHGLYNPGHVTTAGDLARIVQYAMKNEVFMDIFGTKYLEWNGKTWDTTIQTHHKLLKGEYPYEGITGGKNGFVSKSGYTLATTAKKDDLSLIVVTLNHPMKDGVYTDTINLLDYGFEHFKTSKIEKGTSYFLGNQEYVIPETVRYTHSLHEEVKKEVQDEGVLRIQDSMLTTTIPLHQVSREKEKQLDTTSVKSSNNNSSGFFDLSTMIPIGSLCVFMLILVFIRKRRAQR
ncbi:D-alanyl-D-alanine carboxypeptidase family protein [Oceanobacillus halophilus]|uniref:D-alanyl-D-alanine carboxypeptidase n=1 Tax=Oceanobacillus halophilus TaxID=930130 RepID=A0A495A4B1_9BACI|nr:D-alanyl-D-alanine carboxypeptidase family protein [Oceanobacillus halophilus]RKQ33900.1 D-alanyl-D-alanine carboxypeptidase [Oceanobacillus halophilus]